MESHFNHVPREDKMNNEHNITVTVVAPEGMSRECVIKLLDMTIQVGRADAQKTCDNPDVDEDARGDAADALSLHIALS